MEDLELISGRWPATTVLMGTFVLAGVCTVGSPEVRSKLITSEDKFNVHKTLACCCLFSFVQRFVQAGVSEDMAFDSAETPVILFMHLLLSLSSLSFQIPEKRIASGDRIWPEYRLHSIVFAARSLAIMALTWFEKTATVPSPLYAGNAAIVLGTMALADVCSLSMEPSLRTRSIRDLGVAHRVKFFFSMMQMYATATCVVGIRRFSTQYFFVFVVQITAFFLTLRRKNLASHVAIVAAYSLILLMSAIVVAVEHAVAAPEASLSTLLMLVTVGNLAGVLRIGASVSKYVLWTLLAGLVHFARPTTAPAGAFVSTWIAVCFLSCLALGRLFFKYDVDHLQARPRA